MAKYVMVIDEGTTGTRALIYDKSFNLFAEQLYGRIAELLPAVHRLMIVSGERKQNRLPDGLWHRYILP